MPAKVNPADYLWVISEQTGGEERFVGLAAPDGVDFIPAAADKEGAQVLLGRLPAGGGARQVEAIHQRELLRRAGQQGFAVWVVDPAGKVLRKLG